MFETEQSNVTVCMNKSRKTLFVKIIHRHPSTSLFFGLLRKKERKNSCEDFVSPKRNPRRKDKNDRSNKIERDLYSLQKQRQQRRANVALSSFAISRLKRQRERRRKRGVRKRRKTNLVDGAPLWYLLSLSASSYCT